MSSRHRKLMLRIWERIVQIAKWCERMVSPSCYAKSSSRPFSGFLNATEVDYIVAWQ